MKKQAVSKPKVKDLTTINKADLIALKTDPTEDDLGYEYDEEEITNEALTNEEAFEEGH